MNYRQIETSREVRLWITQVIVPTAGMALAAVMMVPEVKDFAAKTIVKVKSKFKKNEA